jgi:NAD(P)-dependent dehydrogenase (short-subunit alcohol dehydrogenase family)
VVADVDKAPADQVVDQITREGQTAKAVVTDVSDQSEVRGAVQHIFEDHGRLDIVVNNAGIIHVGELLETPLETWRRVFRVNVDGTLVVTQAAVSLMRRQSRNPALGRRGVVLNISSLASEIPRPTHAAYAASKAAINSLSRTGAAAFAADEIATVVLYPGNVREGMWRHLGASIASVEGRSRAEVEGERFFQAGEEIAEIARDAIAVPGLLLNGSLVLYTRDVVDL